MLIKNTGYKWFTKIKINTKISEFDNKIPPTSSLVTTTVLNTKIGKVENKTPDNVKYITTPEFNKLMSLQD